MFSKRELFLKKLKDDVFGRTASFKPAPLDSSSHEIEETDTVINNVGKKYGKTTKRKKEQSNDDSLKDSFETESNYVEDIGNQQAVSGHSGESTDQGQIVCSTSFTHDSPKKRRKCNIAGWKRNINRIHRLKGESYCTVSGKKVSAKCLKPSPCINNGKHKCYENIPEDKRQIIFSNFHSLDSLHKQREFFIRHITQETPKRKVVDGTSRKGVTKKYTISSDNQTHRVCRQFFLDTLGISEGLIKGAFQKLSPTGVVEPDRRGGKISKKEFGADGQLVEDDEESVKKPICSFPALESHYCRKKSDFKYLDSNLNIKTMYELYKKECKTNGKREKSYETYRKTFKTYKLKFHKPKKDLCKVCVNFDGSSETEKNLNHDAYDRHQKRKEAAREKRNEDKQSALEDKKVLAFNFDLQSVLSTPKGAAGPFFYVRKLAIYNLTVYNLGDSSVRCFLWDETEGKRGSIEIATCIFKYIMSYPNIEHVKMMSDSCGGQQKNFHFSAMCQYAVNAHPSLKTIDHVYFEPGHSHMECDSIHSKIEVKSKNFPVYTLEGWSQIIRMARSKPGPFEITELVHDDFVDFNTKGAKFEVVKSRNQKVNTTEKEKNIKFSDAVWYQYRKTENKKIFMKTTIDADVFITLASKQKKGKQKSTPIAPYKERLPITDFKKKDLLSLCAQNLIPRPYHAYYQNLPASSDYRDCLPEPNASEEED